MNKTDMLGQIAAINRTQAIIEFRLDGTIITANQNFLNIVGYTLAEIVGQHHRMFCEAAYRDSPEYKRFWEKLGRGEFDTGQYKRLGKAGQEAWLEASYNPILDKRGRPYKIMKLAVDITAQKRRDALNYAIKNSLDTITAKIMAADTNHNIVYMNQAARELLTASQSEIRKALPSFDASRLIGSNIDVFHKNPAHQRGMLSRITGTMNTQLKLGDLTLKLTLSPMKDEFGQTAGTVVEWVDLTGEINVANELQSVVAAVIDGDLTSRIVTASKSEVYGALCQRINELIASFAAIVSSVKQATNAVARGAQEISRGSTDLSGRTEQQASSLEQTAASMEEMTATVRQNADNTTQANGLAAVARDQANKGGAVVSKAVGAMSEISQSSKKISNIISVIDEIAFQTNLLALNAAVEAARAGEQGRGFAVVASEVRNLAGRSATAAKEIKELIRDSEEKVVEGSSLVSESGQALEQIVGAVKKVSDIIAEIAASSQEQSKGIDEVNKALSKLDEVTQQNAALVEETSAASQAMAEESEKLDQLLAKYQVSGADRSITAVRSRDPVISLRRAAG